MTLEEERSNIILDLRAKARAMKGAAFPCKTDISKKRFIGMADLELKLKKASLGHGHGTELEERRWRIPPSSPVGRKTLSEGK